MERVAGRLCPAFFVRWFSGEVGGTVEGCNFLGHFLVIKRPVGLTIYYEKVERPLGRLPAAAV